MIEFPITLTSGGSVCMPGHAFALALGYTKNRGVYRLAVTVSGEWEGLTIRAFWHVPDGKDPASSLVVDGYVAVPASVTAQPGSGCVTFEGSDSTKTMISADLRYRVSANSGTEDGTEPEPGTPAWQQLVDAVHTDATAAEQAKTDAQTAAQQAGASAKKAGQALSDTITAKEDALKAIGDKQAAATKVVDTARDEALQQVEASTEAAQTAASEAATSAGSASQSAQEAAGSLQELKDEIASGDFKGEPGTSPTVTVQDIAGGHRIVITDATGTSSVDVMDGKQGDPGKDATVDTTLTHEGEAADAKATGDAISAVKARQNILVGSEIGNPISVDDAFPAPLCGLTVYGRSTQDGTPTPDAPVPIVSAGENGSVAVKVTGANMLEGTKPGVKSTVYGITYTTYENGFLITGTATNDFTILLHDDSKYRLTHGIYYLTTKGLSPSTVLNFYFINKFNSDMQNQKVTLNRDVEFSLRLQISKGATLNTTVQVSLTRDKTTTYSPYREQLLTLPTPTGLPGIPVTSGGNYTDPQGQQWVCDEVDLERGVKVQRVNTYKFSGSDGFTIEQTSLGIVRFNIVIGDVLSADIGTSASGALCSALPLGAQGSTYTRTNVFTITNMRFHINIENINSLDELQQYLQQTPMTLTAILATPIETPLTPAEIAAYKALTAYGPDTVVQAGDGAGVKLGYQRDVNIAIKRIEDAVASMT